MARYRCSVCGFVFDEEKEGKPFASINECPVCHQPADRFVLVKAEEERKEEEHKTLKLEYPEELKREDESYRYMKEIHLMAVSENLFMGLWQPGFLCQDGTRFLFWELSLPAFLWRKTHRWIPHW